MISKELEEFIKDETKAFEERLRAKAEELQEQIPDKPKTIWDLEIEDEEYYYYIPTYGQVCQGVFNNTYDEWARDRGNAFLTLEEAEFELERRKIEAVMKKYSRPFDEDEINYYIEYSYPRKHINIDALYEYDCGITYFESEEIAQQVIDKIGEDKLKKYWFGVKDE